MAASLNSYARDGILGGGIATMFDSGKLCIYSGTRPATPNLAPAGTLLVEIDLPSDALGSASGGSIAKSGTWQDTSANADGTATWARLKAASDDNSEDGAYARIDMDVGGASSGEDIELQNTSIASGQSVTISTFTITLPASE
jgi:hypothetical protein